MNIDMKLDSRTLSKVKKTLQSEQEVLIRFLIVAHRLGCDIYPTGGQSNKRVLGVGNKPLQGSAVPLKNMFVKIQRESIYLTEGPEAPDTSNLLTDTRAMSVLSHLEVGSGNLPLDYHRP